jgi:hypothetical protein
MQYARSNMHYNDDVLYTGMQRLLGLNYNNGSNCGELVYLSLIKLGLLPSDAVNNNICHNLLYTVYIEKLINNYYHLPIEITINPF